jgi:hypothetical protein
MEIDNSAILASFMLLTILSVLIERSLALFFEQKHINLFLKGKGLKEIIAFGICYLVCTQWSIDIVSMILKIETGKTIGFILTAAAIAGGSKASIKLFQDVIGAVRIKKEGDRNDS